MSDFFNALPAETYSSIFVIIIIATLSLIIGHKVKQVDPLAKPKGLLLIAEIFVVMIDNMLLKNMGKHFEKLAPYFATITLYIFIGFLFGLTGLPSPLSYYINTLTIVLSAFILIHFTAIKTSGWRYFKRFIEPFVVFLPINLISIWAPLISMSFRIFGNMLAGFILMSLVYGALGTASSAIFSFLPAGISSIFLGPIIAPWLHLYFDLFAAFIQTLVFMSLSMLLIAQEGPSPPKRESPSVAVTS
jgi:F-type H+-transporting ATPase subunit a